MLRDQIAAETFTEFACRSEPGLRRGLTAGFGSEVGREAAADGGDRDRSRLDSDRFGQYSASAYEARKQHDPEQIRSVDQAAPDRVCCHGGALACRDFDH